MKLLLLISLAQSLDYKDYEGVTFKTAAAVLIVFQMLVIIYLHKRTETIVDNCTKKNDQIHSESRAREELLLKILSSFEDKAASFEACVREFKTPIEKFNIYFEQFASQATRQIFDAGSNVLQSQKQQGK